MSEQSAETKIAILSERQKTLEVQLAQTDREIASLIADRDKAMRWGILTLGSIVIGMGAWIFNFVTGHLK
jgi:dGTP triphosphohydrolase